MEPLTMKELLSLADPDMESRWETLSLGYTESRGSPLLISEVSRLYSSIPDTGPLAPIICAPIEGGLVCGGHARVYAEQSSAQFTWR